MPRRLLLPPQFIADAHEPPFHYIDNTYTYAITFAFARYLRYIADTPIITPFAATLPLTPSITHYFITLRHYAT